MNAPQTKTDKKGTAVYHQGHWRYAGSKHGIYEQVMRDYETAQAEQAARAEREHTIAEVEAVYTGANTVDQLVADGLATRANIARDNANVAEPIYQIDARIRMIDGKDDDDEPIYKTSTIRAFVRRDKTKVIDFKGLIAANRFFKFDDVEGRRIANTLGTNSFIKEHLSELPELRAVSIREVRTNLPAIGTFLVDTEINAIGQRFDRARMIRNSRGIIQQHIVNRYAMGGRPICKEEDFVKNSCAMLAMRNVYLKRDFGKTKPLTIDQMWAIAYPDGVPKEWLEILSKEGFSEKCYPVSFDDLRKIADAVDIAIRVIDGAGVPVLFHGAYNHEDRGASRKQIFRVVTIAGHCWEVNSHVQTFDHIYSDPEMFSPKEKYNTRVVPYVQPAEPKRVDFSAVSVSALIDYADTVVYVAPTKSAMVKERGEKATSFDYDRRTICIDKDPEEVLIALNGSPYRAGKIRMVNNRISSFAIQNEKTLMTIRQSCDNEGIRLFDAGLADEDADYSYQRCVHTLRLALMPQVAENVYSDSLCDLLDKFPRVAAVGRVGEIDTNANYCTIDRRRAYASEIARIRRVPIFGKYDSLTEYDGRFNIDAFYVIDVEETDINVCPNRREFVSGETIVYLQWTERKFSFVGVIRPYATYAVDTTGAIRAIYEDENLTDKMRKMAANVCYGFSGQRGSTTGKGELYDSLEEATAKHRLNIKVGDGDNMYVGYDRTENCFTSGYVMTHRLVLEANSRSQDRIQRAAAVPVVATNTDSITIALDYVNVALANLERAGYTVVRKEEASKEPKDLLEAILTGTHLTIEIVGQLKANSAEALPDSRPIAPVIYSNEMKVNEPLTLVDEYDSVAIAEILSASNVCILAACPGAGKSTLCMKFLEEHLHETIVVTPSGGLKSAIAERVAGVRTMTLHGLFGIDHNDRQHRSPSSLKDVKYIAFEEYMMYPVRHIQRIVQLAEAHPEIRVLLNGDAGQLAPVDQEMTCADNEKYYNQLIARICPVTIMLRVCKRHGSTAEGLASGTAMSAITDELLTCPARDIIEVVNRGGIKIVDAVPNEDYKTAHHITYKRDTLARVNAAARKVCGAVAVGDVMLSIADGKKGSLSSNDSFRITDHKEHEFESKNTIESRDVSEVITARTIDSDNVRTSETKDSKKASTIKTKTITRYDENTGKLRTIKSTVTTTKTTRKAMAYYLTNGSRTVVVEASKLYEHFNDSYARTCHSVQGQTVKGRIYIHDATFARVDRYWLRTAISRADSMDVHLVIPNYKPRKPTELPTVEEFEDLPLAPVDDENKYYYFNRPPDGRPSVLGSFSTAEIERNVVVRDALTNTYSVHSRESFERNFDGGDLHEIVIGTQQQKPRLDFDGKRSELPVLDVVRMELVSAMCSAMNSLYPPIAQANKEHREKCENLDWVIEHPNEYPSIENDVGYWRRRIALYSSCGAIGSDEEEKVSYHVVVQAFAKNNIECKNILNVAIRMMPPYLRPFVDTGVCKRIQSFRIAGATKTGSSRTKLFEPFAGGYANGATNCAMLT